MSATDQTAEQIAKERDALCERALFKMLGGVFESFTLYLGYRLGFYWALADGGWMNSSELASRTKTHERYVREWLEQQTVAGILEAEDEHAEAQARRFRMRPGHVEPLLDPDSLYSVIGVPLAAVGIARALPSVLDAFRNGGGVPYSVYGDDFREGQSLFNRSLFVKQLGAEFLPAIADVHARLQADPPARVADIGCGLGWSSIAIAQAYPKVLVDGFDLDEPSIEEARTSAKARGISNRVTFHARNASDAALAGRYDLVAAFECIHDVSNPVGVLQTMRRLAGEKGAVLVMDERVGDAFQAAAGDLEATFYGVSVLHCLPVGMAEQPSAATGTVMRLDTLQRYAKEAGFRDVEVLPIDHFFFRFYRLHT